MMLLLLAAMSAESPAGQAPPARTCSLAGRGNVQLAYKPYGSGVFGSDGLHCTTARADDQPAAVKREVGAAKKAKAKRR